MYINCYLCFRFIFFLHRDKKYIDFICLFFYFCSFVIFPESFESKLISYRHPDSFFLINFKFQFQFQFTHWISLLCLFRFNLKCSSQYPSQALLLYNLWLRHFWGIQASRKSDDRNLSHWYLIRFRLNQWFSNFCMLQNHLEGLLNIDCLTYPQISWFSSSLLQPSHLHFSQVPKGCWCCWARGHTLWTTGVNVCHIEDDMCIYLCHIKVHRWQRIPLLMISSIIWLN